MAEIPQPRGKGRTVTFDRGVVLDRACRVFWQKGFEPATMAELCKAMELSPPSLYAAFGNKVQLFLEAVEYYEKVYWDDTWNILETEPDLSKAVSGFFHDATRVLTSQNAPCGCLVILGAANVSPDGQAVGEALRALREEGKDCFLSRLQRGVADGDLAPEADVEALALTLNTVLEGMSIQARDGASRAELERIAVVALTLLPPAPKKSSRKPQQAASVKKPSGARRA